MNDAESDQEQERKVSFNTPVLQKYEINETVSTTPK